MLPESITNELVKIMRSYPEIEKGILFGSRARGDETQKSDIDVAFIAPKLNEYRWVQFVFQLEQDLDTLLSLDLVRLERVTNELSERIRMEGVVIYERDQSESKS